ncbi:MAG TPA: hypothetical protein VGC59_03820 [Solirubrobacteraceae bacterium]
MTPKPSTLDDWLPEPQVRTRHERSSAADPDTLWAAAKSVRLDQTRTIGRLVRWRIPGVRPAQSFVDLLEDEPFIVLDAGERYSISGLCGRIWTLARDYPQLESPDAFRAWDAPRTVRVLFAHWVQREPDGRSTLVSEARVGPTDRVAAMRLRSLWLVIGPFERLIGKEPLELAVAGAEAASAASVRSGA